MMKEYEALKQQPRAHNGRVADRVCFATPIIRTGRPEWPLAAICAD